MSRIRARRFAQPGPGPHQPHPQGARRDAEHLGRFFRRQARQVHQFDRRPVRGGQRGQPGDQRPASAFGIDPVDQVPDEEWERLRVLHTVVDGGLVYSAGDSQAHDLIASET